MDFFFLMDESDKRIFTALMAEALERMWHFTTYENELLESEKHQLQEELKNIDQDIQRIQKKFKADLSKVS